MPSALESRQIRSSASIGPNQRDSSVIPPVHRNGIIPSVCQFLKRIFSDFEFTNLFEIQHADFEIFILQN